MQEPTWGHHRPPRELFHLRPESAGLAPDRSYKHAETKLAFSEKRAELACGPFSLDSHQPQLERYLQPQLHRARTSGSDDGVLPAGVESLCGAPELIGGA